MSGCTYAFYPKTYDDSLLILSTQKFPNICGGIESSWERKTARVSHLPRYISVYVNLAKVLLFMMIHTCACTQRRGWVDQWWGVWFGCMSMSLCYCFRTGSSHFSDKQFIHTFGSKWSDGWRCQHGKVRLSQVCKCGLV